MSRALDRALVALTILACLAAWLLFWQFGGLGLTSHDWPKEALYYDILRSALRAGALPFYMSQDAQGTSWFLAIPEIPTSPQILLLPLLGNGAYAMASCLILWAVGVVGCMLWRREHATPLLPFLWLLLLFSFNGHIVAHLTVGHSMWAGYFLSPFVILFLVRFIEGDRSSRNAVLLGLTLAAMMLQGGFHLAVYFALFVAIAGLASAGGIRFLVRAFLACGLLAAFRILPALIAFQDLDRTFMSGYPGLSTLADALLTVRPPASPHLGSFTEHRLGWWEYDVYVGPAGLLFLGLFGLGRLVRDRQNRPLLWACAVLALLSSGEIIYLLSLAHVPVLGQERVASRFLIAPLVCLIFVAARFYPAGRSRVLDGAAWAGLAATAAGLLTHLLVWRIGRLEAAPESVWQLRPITPQPSLFYERLWLGSFAVSAVGLGRRRGLPRPEPASRALSRSRRRSRASSPGDRARTSRRHPGAQDLEVVHQVCGWRDVGAGDGEAGLVGAALQGPERRQLVHRPIVQAHRLHRVRVVQRKLHPERLASRPMCRRLVAHGRPGQERGLVAHRRRSRRGQALDHEPAYRPDILRKDDGEAPVLGP